MARRAATNGGRNTAVDIVSRCLAALPGNYALTIGIGSLLAVALADAGMARVEAAALASMLAFPVFLIVLLWAVHAARLLRAWIVIGGGAVLTNAAAAWLAASPGTAG
ncbi:iron uptake protein [Glacieibacterium frigidum]|uniref:Iron uptake protein n=1 Tax=Glacieibacterium frigidum TaxID=2593303 RepID=A0A552UAC7_9SPHN|nr:iron uptake protein [Glacieibacterium frigidum]TRW15172.1 iron uptake protein [Glacieibacterium frigidum]